MNRYNLARNIVQRICRQHGLADYHVYGDRKWPGIVACRWHCIYAVHFATGWSTNEVGHFFKMDHSSIIYVLREMEKRYPDVVAGIRGVESRAA